MKKQPHIMRSPRTLGDVFAVGFAPGYWGYCRVIRATAIEIPALFTRSPGMPGIHWSSSAIKRWRMFFLTVGADPGPPFVQVGNAPFAHDSEADMPPTYRDPDNIEPRYTIEERGMYRYTTDPADLKGIAKQVTLLPPTLGSFLREQYRNGTLQEVGVRDPAGADLSCDDKKTGNLPEELNGPAAQQFESEVPTIVFARIVQPLGPTERERNYEQPLAEFLSEHELGEITGAGTMQDKDGSVLFAGIDIEVRDVQRAIPLIAQKLAELGAPEGSELEYYVDEERIVHPIRTAQDKGKSRGTRGQ